MLYQGQALLGQEKPKSVTMKGLGEAFGFCLTMTCLYILVVMLFSM